MILIILLSVAFLVLLERKLLRGVQLRTRPINVRYWGVMQTVVDRLKLLNKPSAVNNIYSFSFLAVIILIRFVVNYYVMVVIMLALMLLLLNRIVMSNNIYSKMGRYRLIVLA
jgi:NADH:ubiquinone oxidoreductase subunit H